MFEIKGGTVEVRSIQPEGAEAQLVFARAMFRSSPYVLTLVEEFDLTVEKEAEFIRDRLFRPFQTTKTTGMGIGAYESFQYVRELGGTIAVKSELEQGTEVTLLLPLFEAPSESDLGMLGTT